VHILTQLKEACRRTATAIHGMDKGLLIALALAFAFTIQGMNWGRVQDWNPDEVALRSLFKKNKPPFEPGTFTKPPFHSRYWDPAF
jgi:hypothetical protein